MCGGIWGNLKDTAIYIQSANIIINDELCPSHSYQNEPYC